MSKSKASLGLGLDFNSLHSLAPALAREVVDGSGQEEASQEEQCEDAEHD